MPLQTWLRKQGDKLIHAPDAAHAVALGAALGMFFGFTPLFGLKTLLALGITWLLRGSKLAAVVGVTLHDIALPLMPVLLRWEYDVGYWITSQPHEFPLKMTVRHLKPGEWLHWSTFLTVGRPMLIGSLFLSTPVALATYGAVRWFLAKRAKRNLPTTDVKL